MPTQKKRQSLTRTADELFAKIVKAPGACVNCGSVVVLQCAHGFSRGYRATRWDLRNAFCLCRACHMHYTHRPLEWDDWLVERWGIDLYDVIRSIAQSHARQDMPVVVSRLRDIWNEIEAAA